MTLNRVYNLDQMSRVPEDSAGKKMAKVIKGYTIIYFGGYLLGVLSYQNAFNLSYVYLFYSAFFLASLVIRYLFLLSSKTMHPNYVIMMPVSLASLFYVFAILYDMIIVHSYPTFGYLGQVFYGLSPFYISTVSFLIYAKIKKALGQDVF